MHHYMSGINQNLKWKILIPSSYCTTCSIGRDFERKLESESSSQLKFISFTLEMFFHMTGKTHIMR